LDRSGNYYWGDEPLDQAALAQRLDILAMESDPPVLSIRADAQLPYQAVITVVDMIKQRKLSKISLDTKVE
jgi:biopolymer transport protein ExbD